MCIICSTSDYWLGDGYSALVHLTYDRASGRAQTLNPLCSADLKRFHVWLEEFKAAPKRSVRDWDWDLQISYERLQPTLDALAAELRTRGVGERGINHRIETLHRRVELYDDQGQPTEDRAQASQCVIRPRPALYDSSLRLIELVFETIITERAGGSIPQPGRPVATGG